MLGRRVGADTRSRRGGGVQAAIGLPHEARRSDAQSDGIGGRGLRGLGAVERQRAGEHDVPSASRRGARTRPLVLRTPTSRPARRRPSTTTAARSWPRTSPSTRSSGRRPATRSTAGYEALVKQFLTDAAAASGTTSNVFSVLRQYGQQTGTATAVPGNYSIAYNATSDSIDDVHPYPSSGGCASPSGAPTCLTDGQVQAEIDAVAPADERGLGNLWFVLLPADVDECITAGSCGTNSFAGYHEAMDRADGVTIYGVIIDPIVEFVAPAGRRSRGQSRRRGDDRHRRPRDRRGDHRSRGHRLGGPQRLRGRRQVRDGPADREPARLRRERLALRPAHRRPRVPDPGDVVQRRRGLRAAHDPDRIAAAAPRDRPDAVQQHGERQHRRQHGRRAGHRRRLSRASGSRPGPSSSDRAASSRASQALAPRVVQASTTTTRTERGRCRWRPSPSATTAT